MKYALEEYVLNEFNASSKARKDISSFVKKYGFVTLGINDKTHMRRNKIAKFLLAFKLYVKVFLFLDKNDILFLQTSIVLLKPILFIKRIRHFRIIYLIHDLFSLRYNEYKSRSLFRKEIKTDIDVLSQCDYIIAHNQSMIARLQENKCESHLISLDIFDYETASSVKQRKHLDTERWEIAFAGFIPKSQFLYTLDHLKLSFQINVYGGPSANFNNIVYKGMVSPEELPSVIEGHFGLIWEGNYQLSTLDNYTMLNNPHKMSMYIVAGLPIIAWKESAAAKFVEKHHLGFTVPSLDDIEKVLKSIDSTQYNALVQNCLKMREDIIKGKHVFNALSQCK